MAEKEQYWQIGELTRTIWLAGRDGDHGRRLNAVPWSAAVRRVASLGGLTVMPSAGPRWIHRTLPDFLRRYAACRSTRCSRRAG